MVCLYFTLCLTLKLRPSTCKCMHALATCWGIIHLLLFFSWLDQHSFAKQEQGENKSKESPLSASKSECLIFLLGYLCVRYKGWPCFLDELFSHWTPRPCEAQIQKYKAPEKPLWPSLFTKNNQAHFMLFLSCENAGLLLFGEATERHPLWFRAPCSLRRGWKKDDSKDMTGWIEGGNYHSHGWGLWISPYCVQISGPVLWLLAHWSMRLDPQMEDNVPSPN